MDRRSLGALIVLNIVLLVGLMVVALLPDPVHAQGRGRSSYTMLSGRTRGRNSQDLIYVANVDTGQTVALLFKSPEKRLEIISRFNVTEALEGGAQPR